MSTRVPPAPGRERRHTTATVAEARRMFDGGWTIYEIARILSGRRAKIDPTTVGHWVDPDYSQRRLREQRERMNRLTAQRTGGRISAKPPRSAHFRFERMKSLRALGLSHRAISTVMTFDFPDTPLSEDQVRYALRGDDVPPALRGLAA